MFPSIVMSMIFALAVLGTLSIKNGWLQRKPKTDEETVQAYLARANTVKILNRISNVFIFSATVVVLFVFFYWTFGRFLIWIWYLIF